MHENQSLPLLNAIEQATGYRPHPSTAVRWCSKPNRHGNVLKSWMIGGRRMTSVEAVRCYNEANTQQASPARSETAAPISSSASQLKAMQTLDREGV